jgi:hypothetical protein
MTALAAMARLQRLGAHLAHGEPLLAADAAAIGRAIERFLDGREPYGDRALYDHLGIALGAGEDPRTELRLERRDRLLAAGIEGVLEKKLAARAKEFRGRQLEYFRGDWRRDRVATCCPYAAGTEPARFWEILWLDPKVLSVRRLRKIVRDVAAEGGLSAAKKISDTKGGQRGDSAKTETTDGSTFEGGTSTGTRPARRPCIAAAGGPVAADAAPADRRNPAA